MHDESWCPSVGAAARPSRRRRSSNSPRSHRDRVGVGTASARRGRARPAPLLLHADQRQLDPGQPSGRPRRIRPWAVRAWWWSSCAAPERRSCPPAGTAGSHRAAAAYGSAASWQRRLVDVVPEVVATSSDPPARPISQPSSNADTPTIEAVINSRRWSEPVPAAPLGVGGGRILVLDRWLGAGPRLPRSVSITRSIAVVRVRGQLDLDSIRLRSVVHRLTSDHRRADDAVQFGAGRVEIACHSTGSDSTGKTSPVWRS